MHGVVLAGAGTAQCDGLVCDHAGGPVGGCGIDPMRAQIRFGARDEEGASLLQRMEAAEVDLATVHHVDGAGFGNQHVKRMNIVQLAVRDMEKLGILPRRSSSVCIFTADLVDRKWAHRNTDMHKSMVVESSA
jgi:hypothetical protein